jgi:hypothetical protein
VAVDSDAVAKVDVASVFALEVNPASVFAGEVDPASVFAGEVDPASVFAGELEMPGLAVDFSRVSDEPDAGSGLPHLILWT